MTTIEREVDYLYNIYSGQERRWLTEWSELEEKHRELTSHLTWLQEQVHSQSFVPEMEQIQHNIDTIQKQLKRDGRSAQERETLLQRCNEWRHELLIRHSRLQTLLIPIEEKQNMIATIKQRMNEVKNNLQYIQPKLAHATIPPFS